MDRCAIQLQHLWLWIPDSLAEPVLGRREGPIMTRVPGMTPLPYSAAARAGLVWAEMR